MENFLRKMEIKNTLILRKRVAEISWIHNEERGFGEFDTHSRTGGGREPPDEVMRMESGRRDSKGTNIANNC